MARPRKNAARAQASLLPPDEVVEIPVEEQPYPLPKGWKWVRLLSVFSNHTDSKKKLPQKEYLSTGTFPVVDQGKEIVGGYTENQSLLYSGPLPVIIFGDHTRCIKFIDFFFVQGADGIKVLHAKNIIIHKFFYYALKNLNMPDLGYRRHFPLFKKFVLPLPPLDEQQRIIDRIESLFAKLDEAKEKVESVLDGFEIRKAAILHKAFTGGLTGSWNIKKDVSEIEHANSHDTQPYPLPKGWKWKILGDVLILQAGRNITAKDIHQERTAEFPYPCYGGNGIRGYVSDYNKDGNFYIIGRQGALCGNIHHASGKFYATEHAVVVEGRFGINIDYAGKYLDFMNLNQYATATAQPGLAVRTIVKLPFLLPTLSDQNSIVSILDSLLAKEQQAKEAAENVLNQIDLMKKAILARAFRGELTREDVTKIAATRGGIL